MPQSSPLLLPLGKFITEFDELDLPDALWKIAQDALLDFVAVTEAGNKMPVVKNILRWSQIDPMPGKIHLMGRKETVSMRTALMATGAASHALDFDDVSWSTIGHPTVAIAPTVFCLGQTLPITGEKLLRAYIVGVEIAHQIAHWTMPALSENGWHTTLANGVFGSCAAASYLLKLSREECINALGIAASLASGLRANFGSQTKALHAGLSNLHGYEAALLAKAGVTSRDTVIEGQDGYAQCFAKPVNIDDTEITIGKKWDLLENGLVFKQYPCCSGSHPANDIWDEFLQQHNIQADRIESIRLGVSLLGPKELVSHLPQNNIEAKFSMEFALASRLFHGPLGIDSFTNENVLDPRVQSLMKKMYMRIDERLATLGFIGTAPVRITVTMSNGEVYRLKNDLAQGNPEKPFTKAQQRRKFFSCVTKSKSIQDTTNIWNMLMQLKQLSQEEVFKLYSYL